MTEQAQEAVKEHLVSGTALKVTPPLAAVTADRVLGLTLNDWMLWLTIVFLLLQIGYLIWKWQKEWKKDRNRKRRKDDKS